MICVRVSINDTFLRLTFQTDRPGAAYGRVVLQFQSCLEESSGDPNKDLWSRFVTSQRFGSGWQTELTGWFVRDFLGFSRWRLQTKRRQCCSHHHHQRGHRGGGRLGGRGDRLRDH